MMEKVAVPVNFYPSEELLDEVKIGDEFTIKGIRLLPGGYFITNCQPGEETLMFRSDKPSIYRIGKPTS